MSNVAPEDRARTVAMLKRWGLWPLDPTHRGGSCCCARCFTGSSDDLAPLRAKKKRVALPWESDYEAA